MLDSQIEEVELSITEARKMVHKRDQLFKLMKNRDFKVIVEDGYLIDEAARLVSISADSNLKDVRDDIFTAIQGISTFRQYMHTIITMGNMAENEIRDNEELLDDLTQEGSVQ